MRGDEAESAPDGSCTGAAVLGVRPNRFRVGYASSVGNNCLVHTLTQLVRGVFPPCDLDLANARCESVRRLLAEKYGFPADAPLALRRWWGRILEAIGVDPSDYRVVAFDFSQARAFDSGGAGRRVLFISHDRCHFAPMWPKGPIPIANQNYKLQKETYGEFTGGGAGRRLTSPMRFEILGRIWRRDVRNLQKMRWELARKMPARRAVSAHQAKSRRSYVRPVPL